MPLVDSTDLLEHAGRHGYAVCAFDVPGVAFVSAVIAAAERVRAPVILSLSEGHLAHIEPAHLLPAMEAAGQRATVPVVLRFGDVTTAHSAVRAVNLGCHHLAADPATPDSELGAELAALAEGCGITVEAADAPVRREDLTPTAAEHLGGAAAGDWVAATGRLRDVLSAEAERRLRAAGSAGQAGAALAACRRWAPVEHAILFNVAPEGEEGWRRAQDLMRDGRDILGAIPGVRRVFVGNAVKADARYRHCWLVRFVHPNVIASYRDHPDHVAFADDRFRPAAQDRVSIDFEEME